jgi:hypothetical protein
MRNKNRDKVIAMCVRLEHFSKNYTQEYRARIEYKHDTHYNTQTRLGYTASEQKAQPRKLTTFTMISILQCTGRSMVVYTSQYYTIHL